MAAPQWRSALPLHAPTHVLTTQVTEDGGITMSFDEPSDATENRLLELYSCLSGEVDESDVAGDEEGQARQRGMPRAAQHGGLGASLAIAAGVPA